MAHFPGTWRHSTVVWTLAAVCIVGGVALRLSGLAIHSLWFDELMSVYDAKSPDLTATLLRDRHPPLFFWALRHWMDVFGESESALRLLPAIVSCVALIGFGAVCLAALPPASALTATALFAVSPFSIWYAQEVRGYSILELASVLALVAFVLARGGRRSLAAAFAAAIATFFALGVHYMGAALLPAIAVAAALAWRTRQLGGRAATFVVSGALAGAAVWTHWYVDYVPQQIANAWGYSARFSWRDLVELPSRLFLVEASALPNSLRFLGYAVGAVVLVGLGAGLWFARRRASELSSVCLAMFVVPIAAALALVAFSEPNFLPRYLMICAPPVLVCVADGLALFERGRARWILASVLLVGGVSLDCCHRRENLKEDFRSACREVAANWKPGDSVVSITGTFEGFSESPLDYYLRDRLEILRSMISEQRARTLRTDLVGSRRVHVVYRDAPYSEPAMRALLAGSRVLERSPLQFRVGYTLAQIDGRVANQSGQ